MDIQELAAALETRDTAMAARMKEVETGTKALKTSVDEGNNRIVNVEQKMARRRGDPGQAGEASWGEQFVKGADLSTFRENVMKRKQSEGLLMKTTLTSAPASAGALAETYRDAAVPLPRRRMTIRDLLPTIKVETNAIEYAKQTARASSAGMVAEGASKPESAMGFELKTSATKVIAHWVPASRQILDDASQLAGMIDTDLRHGLEIKEEQQLLMGDGAGENLLGLIPQATAYAPPIDVGDETIIDQIGLGILQAALTDFDPDGIVMHPSDWLRVRLLKDGDGNYVFGDPATSGTATLWGLPVVATQAMPIDKFLVGSFRAAATIYDRWLPRVEISTEHADFFVRNLVAILAEERLALAVKNGNALVYGDFGFAA